MTAQKKIWKTMEWLLTPEAKEAIERLKQKGLDEDLAFTLLDLFWPEEKMYETPGPTRQD